VDTGTVVDQTNGMRAPRQRLSVSSATLWVLSLSAVALAQSPSERGAQVFAENKCGACHAVAGRGNAKGPLDDAGSRLTGEVIRDWITNAPAMTAKTKAPRKPPMKSFAHLPQADVDALVVYVQSLKK
jgi:mono/diheme cytochrome c family protein